MIRGPSNGRYVKHIKRQSGSLSSIGAGLRLTSGTRHNGFTQSWTGIDRFLLMFRLLWIIVVLYVEIGRVALAVAACSWPKRLDPGVNISRGASAKSYRIVIVASARLPDARSFSNLSALRRHAAVWRAEYVTHKAWSIVSRKHRPDAVIFLGDLLDSGVETKDRDEHSHYTHRFHKAFTPPSAEMQTIHVPGLHDLGFHIAPNGYPYARERFAEAFGPVEGRINLGNHTLVWIDSSNLLHDAAEIPRRPDHSSSSRLPQILLTQMPLSSQHDAGSKSISPSVSEYLLRQIAPRMIFFASHGSAKELIHGSFAAGLPSQMPCSDFSYQASSGERGYHLMSLYNPLDKDGFSVDKDAATIEHAQCSLPSEGHLMEDTYWYLALFTIACLAARRLLVWRYSSHFGHVRTSSLPVHASMTSRLLRKGCGRLDEPLKDDGLSDLSSEEEEDAMFDASYASSYPASPPHGGYAYTSPTDDDYTDAMVPEIVPRQSTKPSHIRRVSRMSAWNADDEASSKGLLFMRLLRRTGPFYAYFVRPIERMVRRYSRRYKSHRLQSLWKGVGMGGVISGSISEALSIAGTATLSFAGIVLWFWR